MAKHIFFSNEYIYETIIGRKIRRQNWNGLQKNTKLYIRTRIKMSILRAAVSNARR